MTDNVYRLRPQLPKARISSWRPRGCLTAGLYYAESRFGGEAAMGMWVERCAQRRWKFELLADTDDVVAAGFAVSLTQAKEILRARAEALLSREAA
ncbi:hypothetical protein [Tardiphaga sp. 841_E9_N1_2]|uniref:hypothetical protein n=1 Tax=Tardiphaga sp. 841_E9_N1_2 TaxID=3240762 RepID=UPI003F1F40A2